MVLIRKISSKPYVSEVLTAYLKQSQEPPWTSFFIRYRDVVNDHRGYSHFNWPLDSGTNYHILRAGCYPFMKYHCTKRPYEDLSLDNKFYSILKIMNLGILIGIPLLLYGLAATCLARHTEIVRMPRGNKTIYFLYEEDKGARF